MDGMGWIQVVCFFLGTADWASAVYRATGDPVAVALLVVCYLVLLLALYCNHAIARAPPGRGRQRLQAALALLLSVLITMATTKVTAILIAPPWPRAVTWAVAAVAVALLLGGALCCLKDA